MAMATHSDGLRRAQDDLDKAALYTAHIALGDAKANVGGDMFTVDCYGLHRDECARLNKEDFLMRGACPGICFVHH